MITTEDAWLGQMIKDEQKRRAKDVTIEQEEKLRIAYPAIQDAYDKYQMLIKLHRNHV